MSTRDAAIASPPTGEEIDLRDASRADDRPAAVVPAGPNDAGSSPPDERAGEEKALRGRRRVVIGVLLLLLALIPLDLALGQVIHDQRQHHLAYDVTQPITRAQTGDAVLILQIPKIGLNEVTVEGAGTSQLRGGPGHVVGTPVPGETGNSVIVARRTSDTGPFSKLHELDKGDKIVVQTRRTTVVAYRVDSVREVPVDSAAPLRQTKAERLTLVTAGSGLFPDRYVVVTASPVPGQAPPVRSTGLVASRRTLSANSLDVRPAGPWLGALAALGLLAVAALAIFVTGRDLRRRYSPLVAAAVLAPVVALLIVLALLLVDVAVPALV
jgi:sortase A